MIKNRPLAQEIIMDFAWFAWLYCVFALFIFFAYRNSGYDAAVCAALFSILAVPFALLCAARRSRKIYRFVIYFILIAAASCAIFFTPAREWGVFIGSTRINVFTSLWMVFIFASMIYSFAVRFSGNGVAYDKGTNFFQVITILFGCLVCESLGSSAASVITAGVAALLLLLRFLYAQMKNLDSTIEFVGGGISQPLKAIISFNNRLFTALSVLIAAAALAGLLFGTNRAVASLLQLLWNGFKRFIQFLTGFANDGPEEPFVEAPSTVVPEMGMIPEEMISDAGPSRFWQLMEMFLNYVIMPLFWLAAAAAVIAGILYLLYKLYVLFYGKTRNVGGDVSETVLPDFVESLRARFKITSRVPSDPVRRLFYNKVRRHVKKKTLSENILASDTASDIAKKIKASEDIDALTARYQQARYDN